ncbi:MAG: hypothetical protein RSB98_07350 [Raoultibacter sp.]
MYFLVGALAALTPWLMKARECFAVSIPQTYARDARLRRFKLHYSIISVVAALVLAGIIAALFAGGLEEVGLIALVIGVFAQMGLSFALMLYYRRRVQAIKRGQGWVVFVFCHWMMLRSKKAVDPEAPASTALAYGLFARAQSIFLLSAGLLMCAGMILIPLSFLGLITLV